MRRLEGKVAIITGASRGVGRADALLFAQEGAHLVICDIGEDTVETCPYPLGSMEQLQAVAREVEAIGGRVVVVKCDVRKQDEVDNMVEAALKTFGRIDILVNNAAICSLSQVSELDEKSWHDMMDVNVYGVWRCSKAVIPIMRSQNSGRIINMSSFTGLRGTAWLGHYAASKHAVVGLTKTMAIELAPNNITVNAICPGNVNTFMLESMCATPEIKAGIISNQLIPEVIDPSEIAEAILYLATDKAGKVTGITLPVDGGWLQKNPH